METKNIASDSLNYFLQFFAGFDVDICIYVEMSMYAIDVAPPLYFE